MGVETLSFETEFLGMLETACDAQSVSRKHRDVEINPTPQENIRSVGKAGKSHRHATLQVIDLSWLLGSFRVT
jgi:hypothetical protein